MVPVRAWVRRVRRELRVLRLVTGHPLHAGRRMQAALRWLRLSLANSVTPGHQVIPFAGEAVLVWLREASSVEICARFGLGEFEDMAFCVHMLRPGDLFCDVGANAGVYTVLAAKVARAEVFAAEPVPRTYDLLMQNIYANGLSGQVDARRCGVGRETGRLHFTASLWSFNHVVDGPGPDVVEVEVQPLDALLEGRVPLVIKIDVEGFEGEVLAGASAVLASPDFQAVTIELTGHVERYGAELDGLVETLRGHGLSGPFWYDPFARKLIPPGKPETRKYNQIFVRDQALAAERLATAPPFEVHDRLI